jgi:hypothetical protein
VILEEPLQGLPFWSYGDKVFICQRRGICHRKRLRPLRTGHLRLT